MVNKVILLGNLGKDPETRTFQNGGKIVTFSLATSETWNDKQSGERRERTEWHNVSILADGLANIATEYLSKGSKVYLEGQLETRKWQDQSGQDRYTTEVVLRPYKGVLKLLDSRPGAVSDDRSAQRDESSKSNGFYAAEGGAVTQEFDEEIPF